MPVIPFVSPKGGCGKSTSAVLLASYLAESGRSVTIIDADPNRPVSRWSKRPGKPKNLSVLENVTEETGGRVLFASANSDLRVTFEKTLAEFRDRYVLSYVPTGVATSGWHRLEVKLKGKAGKVTARRGYFAE